MSISNSLRNVSESVLNYDTIIIIWEKLKNKEIIWEKLKNKDFIKVSYGTELESKNIVDKIMIFVNQIEEKKN